MTVAAVLPNFTVLLPAVGLNPVPVMVTVVPPASGPLVGLIEDTAGVGAS